jgi:hypothetical protein
VRTALKGTGWLPLAPAAPGARHTCEIYGHIVVADYPEDEGHIRGCSCCTFIIPAAVDPFKIVVCKQIDFLILRIHIPLLLFDEATIRLSCAGA